MTRDSTSRPFGVAGSGLKSTTDKTEKIVTNEAVGGVVQHGRLRGSGIARSEDGR